MYHDAFAEASRSGAVGIQEYKGPGLGARNLGSPERGTLICSDFHVPGPKALKKMIFSFSVRLRLTPKKVWMGTSTMLCSGLWGWAAQPQFKLGDEGRGNQEPVQTPGGTSLLPVWVGSQAVAPSSARAQDNASPLAMSMGKSSGSMFQSPPRRLLHVGRCDAPKLQAEVFYSLRVRGDHLPPIH